MMDEEIRQALSEVREMKQMCGNINMKLTNIVTQRGQNWKAKLEAEYQRGLEDAWNVARKIAVETDDGGVSISALYKIFGTESMCMIMKNNTVYDATDKLKAYEEKQKADEEIKVGDEVAFHHDDDRPDTVVVVTYIGQDGFIDGMDGRGTQYAHKNPTKWAKTGRHFDISSILEAMRK